MEINSALKELLPTQKTARIVILILLLISGAIAVLVFLFEQKFFEATVGWLLIALIILLSISLFGAFAVIRSLSKEIESLKEELAEARKERDIYSAFAAQRELSDMYRG